MSTSLTVAAVVFVFGYAVVNAFGAWAVVRRRSLFGAAFFGAAVLLTVGGVAVGYGLPGAVPLVTAGALTASLTSWRNARLVLRRVVPWRHALRAAAGGVAIALTVLATAGR
ncbi:MAG: hypothetical protein ACNA8N_07715 [Trueperaceae bacterium]